VKRETIHIESKTERLSTVRDFVSAAAKEFGFSEEEVGKITLAVDEACTNVIKHAYGYSPSEDIAVTITANDRAFEIAILDHGKTFNPTDIPSPDLKEYRVHPRRGGLGVHLMRALMDKVEYDIVPGKKNEVRLIKYLAS
jgi:serine/threonine-protein kinase RsbW